MLYLVVGLVLFLGVNSVRIFADDWRTERIARMGPGARKGLYPVASLLGFRARLGDRQHFFGRDK